jgi:magnesium chelatase subunit I
MTKLSGETPSALGSLRQNPAFSEERLAARTVKDELRANLICKLQRGETLFPGILGFEDTVVPQMVNAILSRHNFILLGLRGQAKTRLIRMLTTLLDERLPCIAGCEIHDNPYRPICQPCRSLVAEAGEETPIAWLAPDQRYVEKLATPDVTIADMIGDLDPIKAARRGVDISDLLTVHYGLLPRANRGIFAINELPDLAGKIQVGLFNIMQEGDVQIKGYPVRLPLDVMLVFTANPEDYTARGKIITPLKDRIGSEIRTHYPAVLEQGVAITRQEAWADRASPVRAQVPDFIRQIVEQVAFHAREDKRVDKRSGVSQRLPIALLENALSNAERRALHAREPLAVPRVLDVYAALPAVTGKIELEYEGELKGGDAIGRELIRAAVGKVFSDLFENDNVSQIVQWFDLGGSLKIDENTGSAAMVQQFGSIHGLMEKLPLFHLGPKDPPAARAAAAEFILEGLYAHRRINRSEERGYVAEERKRDTHPADEGRQRSSYRRQFN